MEQEHRRPGRPPTVSPAAIEERAINLFVERGFAETTMTTVADACGVGRTTLFRHFPSKAAIIWAGFDRHLARLASLLRDQPADVPVMESVHQAAVAAFQDSVDDKGLWIKRFAILEETRELSAEDSSRWFAWSRTIAEFVATRTHTEPDDVVPACTGGAVQAAYVSVLRSWLRTGDLSGDLPELMEQKLAPVCVALTPLVDELIV